MDNKFQLNFLATNLQQKIHSEYIFCFLFFLAKDFHPSHLQTTP